MSKKTDIETWLVNAAGFQVDFGSAGVYSLPLIVEEDFTLNHHKFRVAAPRIIIPVAGDIFEEGDVFRYLGIQVTFFGPNRWSDLTRPQLILALRELARADLGQAGIQSLDIGDIEDLDVDEKLKVEIAEELGTEERPETPEFSTMTKKEIDEWAEKNGIEVDGRMSKAKMIDFIEAEWAK